MGERLARRVGRLLSGGFHAVLDAAEDRMPEAVMNENIREVEQAMDEVRTQLGRVLAQKHLAAKKMADENNRHENLNAAIREAVAAGRDDLAEAGVAEQMDIEARLPVLEHTLSDCAAEEKELEGFIAALQAKRREMQQALADWQMAQKHSNDSASPNSSDPVQRALQQAEAGGRHFERVLQRQGGLPLADTPYAQAAKLKELEELGRKNRIAERLAAFKAQNDKA